MSIRKPGMREANTESVWAIVPVKALGEAKARLGPVLAPPARRRLVLSMFEDVLDILHRVPAIGPILVVTPDPDIAELAQRKGATVLREGRSRGLNAAIRRGARQARRHGAARALFIPADVPLATAAEIGRIVAQPRLRDRHRPVIVPARDGGGTNALVLSPPDALDPNFGEGSFARHCRQAVERGLDPRVVRLRGLGQDIDEPADLAALLEGSRESRRYAFLRAAFRTAKTTPEPMRDKAPEQPMGASEP
jgi:2-phospho-L-lactate/phosphoenolpyruvate guanylyltransferase